MIIYKKLPNGITSIQYTYNNILMTIISKED